MKQDGELLYLERSSKGDEGVAGLLRVDLKHKSDRPYNQTDQVRMTLLYKLKMWLKEGVIQEVLPLDVDEAEICADIIKRKIGIASETQETWTVNNILLANGLLPEMEKFVDSHRPVASK